MNRVALHCCYNDEQMPDTSCTIDRMFIVRQVCGLDRIKDSLVVTDRDPCDVFNQCTVKYVTDMLFFHSWFLTRAAADKQFSKRIFNDETLLLLWYVGTIVLPFFYAVNIHYFMNSFLLQFLIFIKFRNYQFPFASLS